MAYRTVIFDLDGTLIDTVELILVSHRHATEAVLGAALPDEVLRAGIGRPLIEQMRSFDEPRAQELFDTYRAHNARVHDEYLRGYDGIPELLEHLRAAGVAVGVATSKSRDTVQLAFDRLPLAHLIDALVTVNDTERHKPHPDPVLRALELLGRGPAGACYVGDSPYDLQAARAAGVDAIAVTWGVFDEEALAAEQPAAVARTPSDLEAILLADG